jgi:hypothetical protein
MIGLISREVRTAADQVRLAHKDLLKCEGLGKAIGRCKLTAHSPSVIIQNCSAVLLGPAYRTAGVDVCRFRDRVWV